MSFERVDSPRKERCSPCNSLGTLVNKVGFWVRKKASHVTGTPSVLTGVIDRDLPHFSGTHFRWGWNIWGGALKDITSDAHHMLPEIRKLLNTEHQVCTSWLGTNPVYFITRPEDIQKLMKKEAAHLGKSPATDTFAELFHHQNILHVPIDNTWKQQRVLYKRNLLSNKPLDELNQDIREIIEKHIEKLKSGDSIELTDFFTHLAMEVVSITQLGTTSLDNKLQGSSKNRLQTLHKAIDDAMEVIFDPSLNVKLGLAKRLKKPVPKELVEAKKTLQKTFKENVIDHDFKSISGSTHLFKMLAQAEPASEETKLEDQLTTDLALSHAEIIFLAGHETTSKLMNMTFRMLMLYPDVRKRLQEEFASMREPIERNHIDSFIYLDHVIKEVLRISPPLPLYVRSVTEDFDLKLESGKTLHLKKENLIALSPWLTHRNEKIFNNPDEFNPDRWYEEKTSGFIPFNTGQRRCVGEKMAYLEAKWAVYLLINHFDFAVVKKEDHEKILATKVHGTIQSVNPVHLRFVR